MSRVKQLVKILNGSEKAEFDMVVKSYLKNIYNYNRVVLTDGKNDTGLDIRVFDINGYLNQYQVTIQNSQIKKKIETDIEKASINSKQYGYSNNLYFFYSYELSNSFKREIKRDALNRYNINLEIIDAKQIAEESEDFFELQEVIYKLSGLVEFRLKESLYLDKNKCLVYDLLSYGKSSDLKLEIVEAFIFQCLYERKALTQEEIAQLCIEKFNSKENTTFYSKLINKLYNKEKKLLYKKETKCYSLSDVAYITYSKRIEQIKLDEQAFINEIGSVLKQYNQELHIDVYIDLLNELYLNIFRSRVDFKQLIEDECSELKKILSYAKKQLNEDDTRINEMMTNLFTVCEQNKYLQKICASTIFSSKINIDNLEKYTIERKKVLIDTNIALYILCVFFYNINYNDYNYQMSKSLYDLCRHNGIKLYITDRYLWEITGHIREALDIVPFTKISKFHLLGKPRNVFYRFYDYLLEVGMVECTFSEFMTELGFKESDRQNTDKLNQIITKYLSEMNVYLHTIPCEYNIERTRKVLEIVLDDMDKFKTSFAIENDCIMLKYLADNDIEVHLNDPVFITWDKSMYKILKQFFEDNPNANKWMQFTPGQFIDRYSLLSFSIKSETISKEMLAILSGDIVSHTISLLDSLSLILDPRTEIGLRYTKKITEMKDEQIYTINKVPQEGQDINMQDPIDYVVYKISKLYRDNSQQYFKLKKLFSLEEYIEDVVRIIKGSIDYYYIHKNFDKTTKENFDKLINKL